MRAIFFLVLLAGLGLAGLAVHTAQGYIAGTEAELARARATAAQVVDTVPVYTAARALRYGERLTPEDVTPVTWPRRAVPAGAFTDAAALFADAGGPRAVMRAMEPGEPVLDIKLTQPGQEAGIAARLSPGMLAFTVDVNVSTGVAGFLRPAHRVDVYWTGQGGRGAETTRLLLSRVPVIAVDQSADQDRPEAARIARSVTVEATREQVAALALGQSTGRLSLALVGLADDGATGAVEVSRNSLFGAGDTPGPALQPEAAPVCTVRTRRGAELVTTQIPCTN